MTSMDDGAHAWLITVAIDHFWRVPKYYELSDLVQDGYMCWSRIVQKYETEPGRVRSRGHLMRLFKTSFLNHIHDLSKSKTVAHVEVLADDVAPIGDEDGLYADAWEALGITYNLNEYGQMIAEAPARLRPLIRSLLTSPELPAMRSQYRRRRDGSRSTMNDALCRIVGANPDRRDLVTELRTFLVG